MGLRKEIKAVLNTKGLDVGAALLKIVALVRAEKPKKVKADKSFGLIEIRKIAAPEGVRNAYQFDIFADAALPTSAVYAAIEGYRQEVSICDCEVCQALNKA